ncbi:toxin biosynthesis protein [Colletotrichum camelliae]|nr:toxin biosynthesis protein [Colletotrichum camelliae]
MFSTWDPKVIDLFMEFAIRNKDNTAPKGPSSAQSVSLVTEQYHELANYLKPTFIHGDNTKEPEFVYQTGLVDIDTPSDSDIRDLWQTRTCALQYAKQPGEARRVDVKVYPELGHFLAMEDPKACAEAMADWIVVESDKWLWLERANGEGIKGLSVDEKKALAHTWMESLRAKL